MAERIYLYDTTLRDGAQTQGVDFGPADKAAIAQALDAIGIDYVEGGWPGANPTDDAFFRVPPVLANARLAAFGMTRRQGRSAGNDPGLRATLQSCAPVLTLVGKSWDFQVETALGVGLDENLAMIGDSVALAAAEAEEAIFDAEHFFDGYKANPAYALRCLAAALEAGARWIVLCDTNGGTLPHQIEAIVGEVARHVPGARLGIHCHNDAGTAVAGSLAAVRAGARQVQGTLNGLGERCGNADLATIVPNLMLKMGFETGVGHDALTRLTGLSRALDERLNRAPDRHAPYVGEAAFAHKGGLHVSAILKDSRCYEHVDPALVGNRRLVVVSDQAGRANLLARLGEIGIAVAPGDARLERLLDTVKAREFAGYAYDGAAASFELLARHLLAGEGEQGVPEFFRVDSFRVLDERRWAHGRIETLSEATIKLQVDGRPLMTVAEGNGPVNALDTALRKALIPAFPALETVRLSDYKVRILTPEDATAAVTRVMIESVDDRRPGLRWATVGVSANVIEASFAALYDSLCWFLWKQADETAGEPWPEPIAAAPG